MTEGQEIDFTPDRGVVGTPGHYYPMQVIFRARKGVTPEIDAEFIVHADGSVWVSSWDDLTKWRNFLGVDHEQSAVLVLLLAARGHIREVDREEGDRIAHAALLKRQEGYVNFSVGVLCNFGTPPWHNSGIEVDMSRSRTNGG